MKYAEPRPYADPENAARRILRLARAFEPVRDGRIHIEEINAPFLFKDEVRPPNTRPGWICASRGGGWSFTRTERM
jgi:hypothetical protein